MPPEYSKKKKNLQKINYFLFIYVILLFYGHFIVLWTFQLMKGLQKGYFLRISLVAKEKDKKFDDNGNRRRFCKKRHARSVLTRVILAALRRMEWQWKPRQKTQLGGSCSCWGYQLREWEGCWIEKCWLLTRQRDWKLGEPKTLLEQFDIIEFRKISWMFSLWEKSKCCWTFI